MENIWFVAAAWMGLAFIASVISIRVGISEALVEIFVGVLAGNFLGFHTTPWIDFLATLGSGLLTFLAGAEIDPESLRKHLKPSLMIGGVSFLVPFLRAMAFAYFVIGWGLGAAQIAGIALATTSCNACGRSRSPCSPRSSSSRLAPSSRSPLCSPASP